LIKNVTFKKSNQTSIKITKNHNKLKLSRKIMVSLIYSSFKFLYFYNFIIFKKIKKIAKNETPHYFI